jgi:hypothetical protein
VPTLFRFVMIIAVAASLVYGAMLALVSLVKPTQGDLSVPVEIPQLPRQAPPP